MQCLYGGSARWRNARRCSGCLGAATTTNYSESSCAGVRLRLDRFWSSDELQTAPIVAKHLQIIFFIAKIHRQTCCHPCSDVFPGATTFNLYSHPSPGRRASLRFLACSLARPAGCWQSACAKSSPPISASAGRETASARHSFGFQAKKVNIFLLKAVGVAGR